MKQYKQSQIIPARWSAQEINRRKAFHCSAHSHNGISHAACYNRENDIVERVGALDIEAGALNADFDICLSWAIKESGGSTVHYDHVTIKDFEEGIYDQRVVETLIEDMWTRDRLVTHYGSNFRFDIPFIRSRYLWLKARKLYKGLPFPAYGEMYLTDTYTMSKRLLKITSRRQDNVASVVLNKDVKTKIDKNYWMAVKYGNKQQRSKALEYIVEHNLKDVEQLDGNYHQLKPFCREVKSSI